MIQDSTNSNINGYSKLNSYSPHLWEWDSRFVIYSVKFDGYGGITIVKKEKIVVQAKAKKSPTFKKRSGF